MIAHEQARALTHLGHDVEVFAADLHAAAETGDLIHSNFEGIRVWRVKTESANYSPEHFNFLNSQVEIHFLGILRRLRPDIVHCHNLTGLSVSLPILAAEENVRVVCTLHDYWGFCLNNTTLLTDGQQCNDITKCQDCVGRIHAGQRLSIPTRYRNDFVRLSLDHIDHFITPSEFVSNQYKNAEIGIDKISVLQNGIDLNRFSDFNRVKSELIRITFAGYLGKHKGVNILLAAFSLIDRSDNVVLNIAGQGPDNSYLKNQVVSLGIQDRVHFLGSMPHAQMSTLYESTDIFVLPSIWNENQPVSIMEAMACGIAVVASKVGGISEIVQDGINGILVPPGDIVALHNALATLIASPSQREAMGQRNKTSIIKWGLKKQIKAQLSLYRKIIRTSKCGGSTCPIVSVISNFSADITSGELAKIEKNQKIRSYFIPVRWLTFKLLNQSSQLAIVLKRRSKTRWRAPKLIFTMHTPTWLPRTVFKHVQNIVGKSQVW